MLRKGSKRDLVASRLVAGLLSIAAAFAAPALAGTPCEVPGTYPTIEAAIDDLGCTEITLANQSYDESLDVRRSLTITGQPGGTTEILGRVLVSGGATAVAMTDVMISTSCTNAVSVTGGAQLDGLLVDAAVGGVASCPPMPGQIFADGFESGDTGAW